MAEEPPERRSTPSAARRSGRVGRAVLSCVTIFAACVLAGLSVISVWAADLIGDTDRYVRTVAPLARDPAVQDAITNQVSTLIIQSIDTRALVDNAVAGLDSVGVPPSAKSALGSLSGPIVDAIDGVVQSTVGRVVASPAFGTIWDEVNRTAHAAMVKALTGQGGGAIQLNGNTVVLDLAPVIDLAKAQLVAAGFGLAERIPTVHASYTLVTSDSIKNVRTLFLLLQITGNWLPFITLLIGLIGILLARRRRRALIVASIGTAAAMVILGLALVVERRLVLDALPASVSQPAAAAVIDTLQRFVSVTVRTIGILSLVVALGAYLTGPHRYAVAVRGFCINVLAGLRRFADQAGLKTGPVTAWLSRYRAWVMWALLLIIGAVFVIGDDPTVSVVLLATFCVLAVLAVIEFLAPSRA